MSAQVQGIKVYCRLRPLKKNDKFVKYEIIKQKQGIDVLDIKYKASRNNLNNKYQYYEIFEENTPQSKVFENVALPVLDKFLSGMNSTIFTYGQTCSGKTHTMYGSQEDPGIILRSFEYLFQRTEENKDNNSSLKKTKNINKNIKLNKKVKFTINQKGDISFKNLSKFKINSFNDAIKILEVGDMRKSVSPTSMNIQSSRAHCICRISYKCKHKEIKLNLVDLAGSERISKSFVNEKTFAESRSINASLHYLNLVINVLENPKMHVPYRNSTITSVLKGSLGTKCATAMIATVVLNRQCIAADGIGMNVACDVHDGQFEPYDLIIGDGIINVPAVDVIIPSVMESGDGTNDDQKDLEVNEEVENLPSDVSDNELGLNFEIVDDNSNVPAVYVKAPVVHYGVETDNNQITRLDTIDNNKIVVLKNSGFYRVADVFHKHCKFIVMLMIITLIFKPQRLLWNNELGTDTENFDR
ncbi:kinesin-like protein KIF6 [Melanaphis sacchari]|uniref:kinesin-like protein KIF6 n=1 Tax=Melanaphis sacchari TaxID=742174 RepID=UPI000DC13E1A|nr:kinesin-like protein KIF6 [Melanaphis sacchari]